MNTHSGEEELDVRLAFAALRRRAGVMVLLVLLAVGSALGFSLIQEKQYSAEASLLFRDPGFDQRIFGSPVLQSGEDATRAAATNVQLVSLDVVADRTAEDLGSLTREDVEDQVEVEEEGQSDVVSVVATDPDPEFAAKLGNLFAGNYIEFRREADQAKVEDAIRLVEEELDRLTPEEQEAEEGRSLQGQISQLKTLAALQTGNAELVQEATPPDDPSSPKTVRNTILGGVLGLLLGAGLALLLERLDRRIKDPAELEEWLELPLLTTVPDSKPLAEHGKDAEALPFGEAEAFRMLRTRLRYFNVDRDIRSVVVTSAAPGEGKSTVAWTLAKTAAEAGGRVLLVEADLHNQTFAASAGLAPLPGLAEVLTHQASLARSTQYVSVEDRSNGEGRARHLHVLVGGATPPNPGELLESEEMSRLIQIAAKDYDLLVLDTPPATLLSDAIPLMKHTSGVVVVSRIGKTTRDELEMLRSQLQRLEAPALGVVANRISQKRGAYGYGYYGGSENGRRQG